MGQITAVEEVRPLVRGDAGKVGDIERENMRWLRAEIEGSLPKTQQAQPSVQSSLDGRDGVSILIIGDLSLEQRLEVLRVVRNTLKKTDANQYDLSMTVEMKKVYIGGDHYETRPNGLYLSIREMLQER